MLWETKFYLCSLACDYRFSHRYLLGCCLSLSMCFGIFVQNQVAMITWTYTWGLYTIQLLMNLYLCLCHVVLISMPKLYNLRPGKATSLAFFFIAQHFCSCFWVFCFSIWVLRLHPLFLWSITCKFDLGCNEPVNNF